VINKKQLLTKQHMELRTATKSCRKNFWMIPSRNIQKVDKTHEYSRLNFIRKTTNPKDRESDSFKKHRKI
jgi:hypothetical protein